MQKMREPNSAIVHFYRASVMHADVWRRRLDATTNWAVVSTAALITFTFTGPSNPHFILLLALAFDAFFLFMESRRYQIFDIWRHRVRSLNRWVMAPNISPRSAPSADRIEDGLEELASSLSSTRPLLGIWHAVGYRMRRNYMFVFSVVIATWLLKLWYHPNPAGEAAVLIERAAVGAVPGTVIVATVAGFFAFCMVLTLRAPSEVMEDWSGLGSPLHRMLHKGPVLRTMEPAKTKRLESRHSLGARIDAKHAAAESGHAESSATSDDSETSISETSQDSETSSPETSQDSETSSSETSQDSETSSSNDDDVGEQVSETSREADEKGSHGDSDASMQDSDAGADTVQKRLTQDSDTSGERALDEPSPDTSGERALDEPSPDSDVQTAEALEEPA